MVETWADRAFAGCVLAATASCLVFYAVMVGVGLWRWATNATGE